MHRDVRVVEAERKDGIGGERYDKVRYDEKR
jgi:hypothetical protein